MIAAFQGRAGVAPLPAPVSLVHLVPLLIRVLQAKSDMPGYHQSTAYVRSSGRLAGNFVRVYLIPR